MYGKASIEVNILELLSKPDEDASAQQDTVRDIGRTQLSIETLLGILWSREACLAKDVEYNKIEI